MSTYGTLLKVTSFGESHGKAVGCVIDGFLANIEIDFELIQKQLNRRRPNQSKLTSNRNENDKLVILSGFDENKTLGTPITFLIYNEDIKKENYSPFINIPRPGHGDYTYFMKYHVKNKSGSSRFSGRETVTRVAAGACIEQWLLNFYNCKIVCYVHSVGNIKLPDHVSKKLEKYAPSRDLVDTYGCVKYNEKKKIFMDCFNSIYDINGILIDKNVNKQNAFDHLTHFEKKKGLEGSYYGNNGNNINKYNNYKDDNNGNNNGNNNSNNNGNNNSNNNGNNNNNDYYYYNNNNDSNNSYNRYNSNSSNNINNSNSDEHENEWTVLQTRCPHPYTAVQISSYIFKLKSKGDSVGGIATCVIKNIPIGIGEPIFDKIEAELAKIILSIPAIKGIEFGSGFNGTYMLGSQHNDLFIPLDEMEHSENNKNEQNVKSVQCVQNYKNEKNDKNCENIQKSQYIQNGQNETKKNIHSNFKKREEESENYWDKKEEIVFDENNFDSAHKNIEASNDDSNMTNKHKLLITKTNNCGGILAGITTGNNIIFRSAIKPVSSIQIEKETSNFYGKICKLSVKGMHDCCILPRLPPIIESSSSIVIGDMILRQIAKYGEKNLPTLGVYK
ncbi:chorismate synthase [Plasmodium brasilianum]|uniref:chorismate synthase n=2 Tax=Plasmodium (Plasmodium) TaxID=418103 RepID=A0A1A8W7J0_PLAMA|nr:chorismate synthase [Plasmodium brasilianum]SBS87130.1 chorismate synthase (CS) [Plasmodium malariae]